MPGLFSALFEPEQDRGGNDAAPADGDDGASESSQTTEASADGDVHVAPDVTVSNSMSGSYDNPDGSTSSWERTDTAHLDGDVHAGAAVDVLLSSGDASF